MSSMHLLPWWFDIEWSSKHPRQQQYSRRKGAANNNKNPEFRSSTLSSCPNDPFSTKSHAPMAFHHVLEFSIRLVVNSKRLLLSNSAVLLSTVSRIFESKKRGSAGSRKASTSVELPDTASSLPNNLREVQWESVPDKRMGLKASYAETSKRNK